MKIINVLDNLKVNDIVMIMMDASAITGNPVIVVETNSKGEIIQDLTTGFELFNCNEFLRSLNLVEPATIKFTTYSAYNQKIKYLNTLLAIRKAMEEVSGTPYNEIGYSAQQVYQVILNYLLERHRMATKGWEYAMHHRPLKDWVADALLLLV